MPGSLQVFFGGYEQFGKQVKYNLSKVLSDFQHDMGMYFDYSIREFYKSLDIAKKAGLKKEVPLQQLEGNEPLVAVWLATSKAVEKREYVPDVKRFVKNEYQFMLPRYIIVDENFDLDGEDAFNIRKLSETAKKIGADYILIIAIDGKSRNNSKKWYIDMNQSIFDSDGKMLSINNVAKYVSPVAGNIQATIFALEENRKELEKIMPFIAVSKNGPIKYF